MSSGSRVPGLGMVAAGLLCMLGQSVAKETDGSPPAAVGAEAEPLGAGLPELDRERVLAFLLAEADDWLRDEAWVELPTYNDVWWEGKERLVRKQVFRIGGSIAFGRLMCRKQALRDDRLRTVWIRVAEELYTVAQSEEGKRWVSSVENIGAGPLKLAEKKGDWFPVVLASINPNGLQRGSWADVLRSLPLLGAWGDDETLRIFLGALPQQAQYFAEGRVVGGTVGYVYTLQRKFGHFRVVRGERIETKWRLVWLPDRQEFVRPAGPGQQGLEGTKEYALPGKHVGIVATATEYRDFRKVGGIVLPLERITNREDGHTGRSWIPPEEIRLLAHDPGLFAFEPPAIFGRIGLHRNLDSGEVTYYGESGMEEDAVPGRMIELAEDLSRTTNLARREWGARGAPWMLLVWGMLLLVAAVAGLLWFRYLHRARVAA